MKNKKGQLITGMFVILILALIAIAAFLISSHIRWILIGIGLFTGGIYVILSIKNPKIKAFLAIILIIGGLLFTFGANYLQIQIGYENVYKQNWGHYCCVQYDNYNIQVIKYTDDAPLSKCNDYTNECEYEVYPDRDIGLLAKSVNYQVCDIDGNNCGDKIILRWLPHSSADAKKYFKINVGKSIKFSPTLFNERDMGYIKYNKKVKSFYLQGEENGKIYQQESCVLSSDLKSKTTTDGKNELNFDECQNYMIDFIKVATQTYLYNNQEVICQTRQLYAIDNLQFKDGSINKIQGEKIKSVKCCPSENNCDENTFDFIPDKIKQCTYSSECPNGGDLYPIGNEKAIYYNCINNLCVKKEVQVDCTNDITCIEKYGANSVCDISQINYGKCITSTIPSYCGDKVCNVGETFSICPSDCKEEKKDLCPGWWEYETTKIELDYGFAYWRAYTPGFDPIEQPTNICKMKNWVIWSGLGIIILLLGTIALIIFKPKKRKSRRKRK